MRVCVFTEPHRGATYDDQLRMARLAEDGGFEGFLRADHYRSMELEGGLPGPLARTERVAPGGPGDRLTGPARRTDRRVRRDRRHPGASAPARPD
ncbi:hypothetical protein [Nonomuraea sp. B19D2]|uniref:hypothetical protein n=1 Tax=Nonomuraea sp. B19D2 TaxID=3159561 RepID=UPI0032DBD4D6